MARRKRGLDLDETLSQENPEVQNKLLKDLTDNNQDNEDKQGNDIVENQDNLSIKETQNNVEEPVNADLKIGDRVKVNGSTNTDTMGRRIHNGLKNYVYTIRSIRPDGIACIECLTHVFHVKLVDIDKIN